MRAMAVRASPGRTITWGTSWSTGRSEMSATAPRLTASAAKSWPSVVVPGRQQKRDPARTFLLSSSTEVTCTEATSPTSMDDVDLFEQQVHPHFRRSSNRSVTGSLRSSRPTRRSYRASRVLGSLTEFVADPALLPEPATRGPLPLLLRPPEVDTRSRERPEIREPPGAPGELGIP